MNNNFKPGELVEVNAGMNITKFGTIQRIEESTIYIKHYGGAIVGYKPEHIQKHTYQEAVQQYGGTGLQSEREAFAQVIRGSNPDVVTLDEAESLDEISKDTAFSYLQKADKDIVRKHRVLGPQIKAGDAKAANKTSDTIRKRMAGIDKASERLNKEDVEVLGEAKHIVNVTVSNPNHTSVSKRKETVQRRANVMAKDRESAVDTAINFYKKQGYKVHDHNYVGLKEESQAELDEIANYMLSEEFEQLDELSKDTIRSYWNKTDASMKKRTSKAKQAETIVKRIKGRVAAFPRLTGDKPTSESVDIDEAKDSFGMPSHSHAHVMKKIKDGQWEAMRDVVPGKHLEVMDTTTKKRKTIHVKEDVQIDEEGDWKRAIMRRSSSVTRGHWHPAQKRFISDMKYADNKEAGFDHKRLKSINATVEVDGKTMKEEVELDEAMLSYSDFQDKINMHRKAGNKVVNDKYTDKKATYTTIDQDGMGRKVIHTPDGTKQEHLGSMKGEDDKAETTDKQTEKRGRGRPSGSKSGAR